jgi:tetratricopeptide (TPR) repeat protein
LKGAIESGFELKPDANGRKKSMKSEANTNRFAFNIEGSSLSRAIPPTTGGLAGTCQESIARFLFHIANGHYSLSVIAQGLSRIAELAYGRRDVATLEAASRILSNLPMKTAQDAGLYYSALAANRRKDYSEARSILEPLCETASPIIKARSIQALGVIHWYQNEFEESARFYVEAAKAACDVDGATLFCAFNEIAVIKGITGDHRQAVDDLENLWPLVRVVSRCHPHLFYQYHNEIAVELAAVGRIDEARQAIKVAMSNPISEAYLEWQETAAELAEPVSSPMIAVTVAPDPEPQKPRVVKDRFILALIIKQARDSISDPAPVKRQPAPACNIERLLARALFRGPPRAPPFPSSRAPPTSYRAISL